MKCYNRYWLQNNPVAGERVIIIDTDETRIMKY